ncbi:MAG: AAA family ATPase [bacterium]|nr:AAA family ATPase [bacterium]
MEQIADYTILNNIDETGNSIVYRGKKEDEENTVIIKVLKTEFPSPAEIVRFKQEYEMIKSLDLDGIVKTHDFVKFDDTFALIMEDFDGIHLQRFLKNEELDIDSFLDIAAALAETVGMLHQKNIIHKDIKPQNILIDPEKNKVKLADFGISSVLTHENEEIYNPRVIEGTLAYMSPEQTGRMNCDLDYRTDLYSLGVTFYEMLTGSIPFRTKDPMEMIHAHIAREPLPPSNLNNAVPEMLSAIIMKLMAKNADERYQNSYGLLADINKCREQINSQGTIQSFDLGENDISLKFTIPHFMVGREREITSLMRSFERAGNGSAEMMLVSGKPGVGKTALINEIRKPIVEKRGYYISGKYDRFGRDVPYSAFRLAFQELISRLFVENNEEMVHEWKAKLMAVLGSNGKVITSVIPNVELIIGEQTDVAELGPEESQNRFSMVFESFISVFATKEHPLVIFLDDLQWADAASLRLMKTLISGGSCRYLFIIGAFRDREVSDYHPLMVTLDEIQKAGVAVKQVELSPLSSIDVNRLVAKILRCNEERSTDLAELVRSRTNGNPFFINQFFKTLYDERMLELDPLSGWKWEMEDIHKMQVTDNVVDLMAEKISRLAENSRDVLKICSCLGNSFNLETLALVYEKRLEETLFDLAEALLEGFVTHSGDVYRFTHDRIQEAAYSLISATDRVKLHYKIARKILDYSWADKLSGVIFYIVDQFYKGLELVAEQKEKIELAKLFLKAGDQARNSSAYDSAVHYLKTGTELLPKDCWENNYELTYSLYKERLECEYLDLNFAEAEKIFSIMMQKTRGFVDKADLHTLMIILYTTQGRYKEALILGYKGMEMLGQKQPKCVHDYRLGLELARLRIAFGRRKIEDLIDLPVFEERALLSYAYLAIHTATVAYYVDPNRFAQLVISGVYLILKHGNFEYSPFAFNALGTILGPGLGFHKQAYRLGKTALKLNEKIASTKNRCKIEFLFSLFILHWRRHARECLDYYRDAYRHGLESGDLIFSGHSINLLGMTRIMLGDNIDEVLGEYGKYEVFQKGGKDPFIARNFSETIQMCLCLKGLTSSPGGLNSKGFSSSKHLDYYREEGNQLGVFYFLLVKLRIDYLFGNYSKSFDNILEMKELISNKVGLGSLHIPEFYFYYSLTLTALYPAAGIRKKIDFSIQLKRNRAKLKKWAINCPENYLHKYLLVKAETARVQGKKDAPDLYDQAIKSAKENGYTQNVAIGNELAALYYINKNDKDNAKRYMNEARRCYLKWGATAKAKDLEQKYQEFLSENRKRRSIFDTRVDSTMVSSGSTRSVSENLDIGTIIKASQALSEEIDLGSLLVKIIKFAIENAGAEKGFLVLENEQDHGLYIEAEGRVDHKIEIFQALPLEESRDLSTAIVKYVNKTGEDIVLNDARKNNKFSSDPYIIENSPRSILCAPVTHKGMRSGIIYLENRHASNAFTPERLEVLKIFSAQASISIENTRLLAQREKAVKLETEMKIAANIQSTLLPRNPHIDGFDITAYVDPADDVGGDYYDVINGEKNDWIIIGDVAGHGISAGLLMMMVQTSIQTILRRFPDTKPSDLLEMVNEVIKYNVKQMKEERYMTITALSFNKNGQALFSGLHQDILIYRASSSSIERIATDGLWLSPWDLGRPEGVNLSLTLEKGDILLLYTDGITEAKDVEGTEFSEQRLGDILNESGHSPSEEIKERILEALTDYDNNDDVTMVIVKKL